MSNYDPPQQPGQPGWQQQPPQQQPPQQPGWQQQPLQQPGQPGWQQQGFSGQSFQSNAKKSPVGRVLLGVALFLVVGIGGVVVFNVLRGSSGGAASPQEAVDNMVTAFDNEDFLTIGESLAPNEREAMFEPTIDLLVELERLDVLEDGASGEDISGIDITVTDVVPRIEPVNDKISWVTIDSGTITTVTNPAELPVGDLVRDEVVNEPAETEVTNLAVDPINFAVVEQDGRWYASFYYSIAEQARRDEGLPAPNLAAAPTPVGAASPEELVGDMVDQMSALNAEGVLALMDPEEFQAAYDYSSLYIPDIQAELETVRADAQASNASWNVEQVTTRTEERNGDTVVIISNITLTAVSEGESATVVWDGNCFSVTSAGEPFSYCRQDLLNELEPDDPVRGLIEVDYGFRVVERDGRWYMSGYPTLVGGYSDGLRTLTPAQLEMLFGEDADDVGGVEGLFEQLDEITI